MHYNLNCRLKIDHFKCKKDRRSKNNAYKTKAIDTHLRASIAFI